MNQIPWNIDPHVIAGTTLRDQTKLENNNMALHTKTNQAAVIENRRAFCKELDIALTDCTFAQQTHSDHMYQVTKKDRGKGTLIYTEGIADCDALYTKEKNVLLGVFHADCVPVLLYDPFTQIIAAIHSGWQGTVKEITRKTVEHLVNTEHVDPSNLHAYIGPAIAFPSLEIGEEVIEQIKAMSFSTTPFIKMMPNGKALFDNKGCNRQMLLDLGVSPHHITVNLSDTFMANEALFSYRRDHDCGRHLSYMMMSSK